MTINIGDWVMVNVKGLKYKGYVLYRTSYETRVDIYVSDLKDFSPHVYPNDQIILLPLDTFANEKEMYIDAALLLGCRETFMEVTNNENRRV